MGACGEAKELYDCWVRNSSEGKRGEKPPKEVFREFFWLFEPRGERGFEVDEFENVMRLCGTYETSVERFESTARAFDGYDDFLAYVGSKGCNRNDV